MRKLRTLALLGLLGSLVVATGFADDEPPELRILTARIDFGPRPGTDRLTLRAAFDPTLLVAGLTPANSALAVTIGPATVISLPPLDDRMRLRSKKDRIYRLRVKATRDHRDTRKLRVDVVKGILKLTAERVDLRDVRGLGAEEVSFTLTVAGVTLANTLEMGVRDSCWRYRFTGKGQGVVGGNQGGGGLPVDPEDPGDPEAITFRILPIECHSITFAPKTAVFRTESEFAREWAKYASDPYATSDNPLPTVDFTKEIVLLIDFGLLYLGGDYSGGVKSVTEVGDGLSVEWMGWSPGNCPVLGIPEPICLFVAVTRRDGPVTFTKETVVANCQ